MNTMFHQTELQDVSMLGGRVVQREWNRMTPINHPLWFPLREFLGSFPNPGSFPTFCTSKKVRCWTSGRALDSKHLHQPSGPEAPLKGKYSTWARGVPMFVEGRVTGQMTRKEAPASWCYSSRETKEARGEKTKKNKQRNKHGPPGESQSKPGIEMAYPEPCKELRRRPQLFRAKTAPY